MYVNPMLGFHTLDFQERYIFYQQQNNYSNNVILSESMSG